MLLIICSIIQYELGLLLARTIQDKQLLDKNLLLKHQIKLTILIVCLSAKELDEVSGGIDGDDVVNVDNIRINGWSYKELYKILCWTYESYYIPGESWDYAKGLTVDVAESFIPSVRWKQCMYLPYPQFIQEAMRRIWLKIPT